MDTSNPKKTVYNKTVLIVEDETAMQNALFDKFTMEGFFVVTAKNGVDGLEQATREIPDLILLDIIMPIMDGMTLLKEIRARAPLSTVPIILLSNLNPNDEVLYTVNMLQPTYYMIKSETKLEVLIRKVKEILKL